MKKILCLAAGLLALNLTPGFAQPAPAPNSDDFQKRLRSIVNAANPNANPSPALTKFNLDFPGGTPAQLVAAIEKAMGKPLNVIIPPEEKSDTVKYPSIKVNDMDVVRLFKTIERKDYDGHEYVKNMGFYTEDQNPTDNSLWSFVNFEKKSALTKFSLDFPGGTPAQLAKAIEKAMSKPLNVVINKEDENTELPPLKMNDVFLPQLFTALEAGSRKEVAVANARYGTGGYEKFSTGYGFKSADDPAGSSVWYFHVEKPSVPPKVSTKKACQYYSVAPYLNRGFTVDDITTAIQTGWKMSGETALPELNYHKETKLLIAYGEPEKLKVISDVLKSLEAPKPQSLIEVIQADELKRGKKFMDEMQSSRKSAATNSSKLDAETP